MVTQELGKHIPSSICLRTLRPYLPKTCVANFQKAIHNEFIMLLLLVCFSSDWTVNDGDGDDVTSSPPNVEESNILYVAVTRAKKSLILTRTLARVFKEAKVSIIRYMDFLRKMFGNYNFSRESFSAYMKKVVCQAPLFTNTPGSTFAHGGYTAK